MDTPGTNSWMADETGRAEQASRSARRPYQASGDHPVPQAPDQAPGRYPPSPASRQAPGDYLVPQTPYQAAGSYPVPQTPSQLPGHRQLSPAFRQVSTRPPMTPSISLQPARHMRRQRRGEGQVWIRRQRTWPQQVGGLLIVAACVASVAWYVPRVLSDDRHLLTGTVTSSGVITLNFAVPGEIGKVNVRLDQKVRKGQVLAAEYSPNVGSVVAADKAAIAAEKAKMAELRAAEAADPAAAAGDNAQLGAENAQLALDEAQLATDQMKAAATEIIAPSSGTVIAANGQPGETVTSAGIRNYLTDSAQAPTAQTPEFSLFPEGPQSGHPASAKESTLPVIALRVSTSWQVVTLISEDSISRIKSGQDVTVSVPAAHITAVRGRITEVLPTATSTSDGVFYQAVITIIGHATSLPLTGMTAEIQLGS